MRSKSFKTYSFWKSNPIIRPAILFTIGLLIAEYLKPNVSFASLVILVIALLTASLLLEYAGIFHFSLRRKINSASLLIVCLFTGALSILSLRPKENDIFLPSTFYQKPSFYKVSLFNKPSYDSLNESFSATVSILAGRPDSGVWHNLNHRVKLKWLAHSTQIDGLSTGIVYGQLTLPRNQPNETFDYRQWLINQEIGGEIKLDTQPFFFNSSTSSISSFFDELRNFLLERFRLKTTSNDQFQFISALLLGKKDELPKTLKSQFATSGIIHLLAVSGLHVGLVFHIFLGLTWVIPKRHRWQRLLKALILIALIWAYALLTGLSPSVCRASAMLTILSITTGLNRRNPSLNVLAGAWILILVLSPQSIRSIGFLLSFSAVYGIIAAKPLIRSTRVITNRPLNYLMQAMIISIMAQLATLPLTLVTFGSFPVYFLLSNLIAIPLASCILYLGFACLFLQFLPFIGGVLIQLNYYGVDLLIQFSALISKLPSATLAYRPQNYFSILLITIITLLVLHITTLKRYQTIFISQLSLAILLITQIIERFDKTDPENFNALLIKNKHELIISTQKNNLQTDSISISRKLIPTNQANMPPKHFHYFVFHKYHVLYVDSHIVPEDLIDRSLTNMIFIIDRPSTETLVSMISSERANVIFPVSTSDYHKYLNLGGEKEKIWPIWFTNKYSIDLG